MSFVSQDDVLAMVEGLVVELFRVAKGKELTVPLRRLGYDEALARYGVDKPDTRFGLELVDVTELVRGSDGSIALFSQAVGEGGIVKCLKLPGGGGMSRTELDGLEEVAKSFGARGLARAKVAAGGEWTQSPLAKSVSPALRQALNAKLEAVESDVLLFQFGKP